MSQEHLMESIFDKVLEEKRNNTPVPTNEEPDAIDIELAAVEDNKTIDELTTQTESMVGPISEKEERIAEVEETTREEAEPEKKSKYVILCASLCKLLCRK